MTAMERLKRFFNLDWVAGLILAAALVGLFLAAGHFINKEARGAPPEGADMTFAPWYKGLRQPQTGGSCCDVADCRPVRTRIREGRVEAYAGRGDFGPTAPDGWVRVPEEVMIRGTENPVGEPVMCWFMGRPWCFHDASGT